MDSYARSIGWKKNDYETAIGIRLDEPRRVRKEAAKRDRIVYPLVDWEPTDKQDVLAFFEDFDWDLKIPEHDGNYVRCFKKSDNKLLRGYRENPFRSHSRSGLSSSTSTSARITCQTEKDVSRVPQRIRADSAVRWPTSLRYGDGGCSESYELYETEQIDIQQLARCEAS